MADIGIRDFHSAALFIGRRTEPAGDVQDLVQRLVIYDGSSTPLITYLGSITTPSITEPNICYHGLSPSLRSNVVISTSGPAQYPTGPGPRFSRADGARKPDYITDLGQSLTEGAELWVVCLDSFLCSCFSTVTLIRSWVNPNEAEAACLIHALQDKSLSRVLGWMI